MARAMDAAVDRAEAQEAQGVTRLRHDLRQSLCAMSAMIDIIREDPAFAPGVLGRLQQIRDEAGWMATMLQTAEDGASRCPIDVGQAVAEIWDTIAQNGSTPVRLQRDAVPMSFVDPVMLRRAVRNLIDNAVRAAGPAGRVEVRVRPSGDWVVIDVADSGPGFGLIPAQDGLGLITVRRFATSVGGTITIDRSTLGGALVTLRLPSVVTALDLTEDATA